MFHVALKGFLLGASLIIAIGMQNAFILRQGLKNRYIFICCFTAALIDALLIIAGVSGFGLVLEAMPSFIIVIKWVGAIFLFAYGFRSFRKALRPGTLQAAADEEGASLRETLLVVMGLTLLNPHVYLDTVLLLGGVGGSYHGMERVAWTIGATTASFIWFFSLGYGARALSPVFAKPKAWQVLDLVIGVTMVAIGYSLIAEDITRLF